YNEEPCQSNGGRCWNDNQCLNDDYKSGECPTQSGSIKCCYSGPSDGCATSCGTKAKELACDIQAHSSIYLLTVNPSGVDDGADAASNIRDTCNGCMAKRSSYSCSSGTAPGGYVCLSESVLGYILDVGNNAASPSNTVQVNSIAGACHSTTSYHYRGTAVDFQVKASSPWETYMNLCAANGAVENLGPGDPGHSSHTHCAFSS
ncbi:uncharacterized protein LOC102809432, partial [Saccoglossus kowalevskii]|uniref:Uncharacterized protein LOC102809432 n=1 Tax=Saccoglossus kowalevskii TaxID=10224 RepID=A0ABM0LV48_SACKO